jgi:hypothetical protein
MEMSLYKPKKENLEYLDQELNLWQDLEQEKARFSLKLKSLRQKARLNENVIKHYESLIKGIEKNIEKLLKRLPKLEDEELKDNKIAQKHFWNWRKTHFYYWLQRTILRILDIRNRSEYFESHQEKLFWQQKITIGKCRTTKDIFVAFYTFVLGVQ